MSEQGLHVKYNVTKVDTGEVVGDCFVLRPDKDKAAVAALFMYTSVTENKELSNDIFKWLESLGLETRNLYTREFLQAINKNQQLFENLLGSIIESPFQSEHGDLWVSTPLATAICTELYHAAIDGKFEDYFDFRELADKKEKLLHIVD